MPNVTVADMLEAQRAIVAAVPGVGQVLTRERYVDADGWISLFTSLNSDESPTGVMILWNEMVAQVKGPRPCTVQQRHKFSYEILFPFDDARPDGRTSHEVFVEQVQAINDALNVIPREEGVKPWDLGLTPDFPGSDLEHQFLQSAGEMGVKPWGNGSTAVKTHYAPFTLEVICTVLMHEFDFGS